MAQKTLKSHATSRSIVVGLTLLAVVVFVWSRFKIPEEWYGGVLAFMTLFVITLLAVMTYQAFRIYESAQTLAKDLTKDMLSYSHELFSELYRSSPVPYVLIDAHGNIESINYSSARFFKVDIEAMNGIDAFSLIAEDDSKAAPLIPEYYTRGKFVNDAEVRIKIPSGEFRWVMLSLFSFYDAKRDRKGLLTLVDVTKQKQIDKAKTEFVSLASHQLRTPISGMKWNIELLLSANKENLSPVQVNYIEKISHGLERMDMLVSDFLSASKFELGTLTPDYSDVDIAAFLADVRDDHSIAAQKKGVTIETDWHEVSGMMHTDSHLLHMITSNLLSNAVKYTSANGAVYFYARTDSDMLTVTITDTGIGIPYEEQEMIFSKMFRADNARSQVPDGTGLGLYIVHEAVKILRGKITFESKEGVGTSFTVTLPIR